ncbi:unnamed protein product [Protopolystoma xenopodis]|uniref:Uncharacterized protein n=1 Tax=Protopolystoma xenopodis TaxID=117903 RepID=A0A448WGU2_9PLAT|nr:unnamed protein product [Protopolystoma xenopodis]
MGGQAVGCCTQIGCHNIKPNSVGPAHALRILWFRRRLLSNGLASSPEPILPIDSLPQRTLPRSTFPSFGLEDEMTGPKSYQKVRLQQAKTEQRQYTRLYHLAQFNRSLVVELLPGLLSERPFGGTAESGPDRRPPREAAGLGKQTDSVMTDEEAVEEVVDEEVTCQGHLTTDLWQDVPAAVWPSGLPLPMSATARLRVHQTPLLDRHPPQNHLQSLFSSIPLKNATSLYEQSNGGCLSFLEAGEIWIFCSAYVCRQPHCGTCRRESDSGLPGTALGTAEGTPHLAPERPARGAGLPGQASLA